MMDEPTLETCPECNHPFIVHVAYGCHYGEDAELAALRAKAALFDALAAAVTRDDSTDWEIYRGIETPVVIYMRGTGEKVNGATLAEAVKAAMEAENA